MLQVIYEAANDLESGRLARIDEDRGVIHVKVDKHAPLGDVVEQLRTEFDQFVTRTDWYQLWRDEIVSRHTPGRPLRLQFVLVPDIDGVIIFEDRGLVSSYVAQDMTVEQFAAAMNEAVQRIIDGGCWFQLFGGEIIDHSPETMSRA